jgi:hypothetical protein
MEPTTETVSLPDDYFANGVWNAYSDPRQALFREVLQNAVDSGATQVRFELSPTHFTIEDDGEGMDEAIIRPALLTLNGSYKRPDSVGGFGSAKEIILFAQRSYEVHTRDVLVRGSGIRYTLEKTTPRRGTRITLQLHDRFEYSAEGFLRIGRSYLAQCDCAAEIYLNGDRQPSLHIERVAGSLPWGSIRIKQLRGGVTNHALVRVKGVLMFQRWVGEISKLVCIDIERPSTQVLTSNRDGFSGPAQDLVSAQFAQLAIDKESYGRKTGGRAIIRGAHSYYLLCRQLAGRFSEIVETLHRTACSSALVGEIERVYHANTGLEVRKYFGELLDKAIVSVRDSGQQVEVARLVDLLQPPTDAEKVAMDFAIHYGEYEADSLPEKYHPAQISARLRTLVDHWRSAVAEVARIEMPAGHGFPFRIGWTFEEIASVPIAASYHKENGVHTFLLNPKADAWKGSARQYLPQLVATAAHEFVHSREYHYHDERFARELTELTGKILADSKLMGRVRAGAKQIQAEITPQR